MNAQSPKEPLHESDSLRSLTTGGPDDPFLPHLLEAIFHADEIELAVAFIKITCLRLIFDALAEALERGNPLKILTTDYLNVTDPEALRQLMLLSERGADVRIFESAGESFHLKALNRAGHAHRKWVELAGERTLAFCISIRHADYMAEEFNRRGISSASVHGESGPSMVTCGNM